MLCEMIVDVEGLCNVGVEQLLVLCNVGVEQLLALLTYCKCVVTNLNVMVCILEGVGVLWWPQRGSPPVPPGVGVAAARFTSVPLGPSKAALCWGPAFVWSHRFAKVR